MLNIERSEWAVNCLMEKRKYEKKSKNSHHVSSGEGLCSK